MTFFWVTRRRWHRNGGSDCLTKTQGSAKSLR
jgi:hypothetical protein